MPRLIWVFTGCTGHFVHFVMLWLICECGQLLGQVGRSPFVSGKPVWAPLRQHVKIWIFEFFPIEFFFDSSNFGERGGSVVECRTPEREVRGSRPTAAVLCPWARHFTPRKYWLITQEAMAPSRYDWKIVDWDVKPQHNQIFQLYWLEMSETILKGCRWLNMFSSFAAPTKAFCLDISKIILKYAFWRWYGFKVARHLRHIGTIS